MSASIAARTFSSILIPSSGESNPISGSSKGAPGAQFSSFFMMGGLLTFLLTDSNFLSLMMSKVPEDFQPFNFGGTYQQAISYIMKAYYDTLDEVKEILPSAIEDEIIQVISEMTHPIPEKRGNPQNLPIVKHKRFSLQKHISLADRLSKKVAWAKI